MNEAIRRDHRIPEAEAVARLRALQPDAATSRKVTSAALRLATAVRAARPAALSAESFLRQYGLTTREGVALMCVAEALLRIPDAETADALLREKLSAVEWGQGAEDTWAASAADWALMLTGTLARWHDADEQPVAPLKRLAARIGEPVVRTAVRHAMRILAGQFVIGETIEDAVTNGRAFAGYRYSFDMLGEAARTAEDAERYFEAYAHAIRTTPAGDAVSVKLSALHPRFEEAQRARVFSELLPRIAELARLGLKRDVGITIDAEESERLELTLDLFDNLSTRFSMGLAVQAYQKRALAVCDWLIGLRRTMSVRLVKGAYWDGEIKRAQQLGMADYPVFTRKAATDMSYVACATRLLSAPATLYPAFATHNCRTVATILELAGDRPFEFQKLFGMGDALYQALLRDHP
ncbi:MAG: proline dehydrogenase family protein, partial [Pseudomonadota bacterium]